jgi:hypothetical protein
MVNTIKNNTRFGAILPCPRGSVHHFRFEGGTLLEKAEEKLLEDKLAELLQIHQ